MTGLKTWCSALLMLAIGAACEGDSSTSEVAGLGSMSTSEASSRGSGSGSDSDRDSDGFSKDERIAIRDDCDPRDAAYDPTGGCHRRRGDVTFAEFLGENDSPLSSAVIGHQAWRNDPSYLKIESGRRLRIRNEGGRAHTFTRVANFGGGKIGPPGVGLNEGMGTAPECPASDDILPGDKRDISGLAVGNHRFQCCIHPWMRALVKVQASRDHDDH